MSCSARCLIRQNLPKSLDARQAYFKPRPHGKWARLQAISGRVTYKNYALDEVIKRLPEYQKALNRSRLTFGI